MDADCSPDSEYPGRGWEQQATCLVPGASAAPADYWCTLDPRPELPPGGNGYIVDEDGDGSFEGETCMPPCGADATYDEGRSGRGYENGLNCIQPDSIAAAEAVACVYEAPSTDPPPGTGWLDNSTATMFGGADCQSIGADDPANTNIDQSACVGRGAVSLDSENRTWFGAPGDLSSIWKGATCVCPGSEPCGPSCDDQKTCGRCFEVACNPDGTYTYPGDNDTRGGYCRTDPSVVIQVIDACPHNHPFNTCWCTDRRPNHIDLSCSAFASIVDDRQTVGNIGSLSVWARPVDCSTGLGPRTL